MSNTIQRTKAQAIFFLLGAVLVGGALGFTANRAIEHRPGVPKNQRGSRDELARRLALDASQRVMMDSVLDARNETMKALLAPIQPRLDSVRLAARAVIRSRLTADQQRRLDAVLLEASKDDSSQSAKR
ncbi:MAG: hypothetical protein IT355_15505 [Gemmatimonadaceae bacterium]|nr:hypothetical protein [Gemmatimonadaceae bacterium]